MQPNTSSPSSSTYLWKPLHKFEFFRSKFFPSNRITVSVVMGYDFDMVTNTKNKFTSERSQVETSLIKSAKWIFFLNKFVNYWPFSISTAFSSLEKSLNFHFTSLGFIFTFLYISLNILYIIAYIIWVYPLYQNEPQYVTTDKVIIVGFSLMPVVCSTIYRIYSTISTTTFKSFWEQLVNLDLGRCA